MTPQDEQILDAYCTAHPQGRSALRPGRINMEEISRFSEWFVTTGRGTSQEAGEVIHRLWADTQR
jgi:hypothetical protein